MTLLQTLKRILEKRAIEFLLPSVEEFAYLLEMPDVYRNYNLALAWMQDLLLNYTDNPLKPHFTPEEAIRKVNDIIDNPETSPIVENLSQNFEMVLQLTGQAREDEDLGNLLVTSFLDSMIDWLNHLDEARRTGDKDMLPRYFARRSEAKNALMSKLE